MKASVIIPTYNKKERLELVLESFNHQRKLEDFEVILVDDGSTDGTKELVGSHAWKFSLSYVHQENAGRSQARNTGIAAASHELMIFCDDDLLASKGFVDEHIKAHDGAHGTVVHGLIYNLPYLKFFKDPSKGIPYEDAETRGTNLEFMKSFLISTEDLLDFRKVERQKKVTLFEKQIQSVFEEEYGELKWLAFTGGNVSCFRADICKAGLFDTGFGKKWGCEDIETGFRLFQNGARFIYSHAAYNFHMSHYRATFNEESLESVSKFYGKHPYPHILHLQKLLMGDIKNIKEYMDYVVSA